MANYRGWREGDPWTSDMPDKLYAVRGGFTDDDDDAWTVSPDPKVPGWEVDCGVVGYSIPRHVAEEIARRYNDPKFGATK